MILIADGAVPLGGFTCSQNVLGKVVKLTVPLELFTVTCCVTGAPPTMAENDNVLLSTLTVCALSTDTASRGRQITDAR